MPLPSAETTPPVTKTYFVCVLAHAVLPSAVEVAQDGRRLDQGAEGAALADEGEEGERADRAPPPPSRELLHGRET